MVAAMALSAGLRTETALLAAAVLAGQLSVGWSNDAIDAPLDRWAQRRDKPIAVGAVSRRTVAVAAGIALVACVPLSLALGPAAGAAHLVAVAMAWAYNLRLKRTAASPLPYAIAFGLLPVAVAALLPGAPAPRTVLVAAGAACGVAAHFANTVGDVREDALTGVRGLPQRLGPAPSTLVAGGFVLLAAVLLLVATGARALPVAAVVVDAAVAAALPLTLRRRDARRLPFRLVMGAVGLLVVALVVSGGAHLVGG